MLDISYFELVIISALYSYELLSYQAYEVNLNWQLIMKKLLLGNFC